MGGVMHCRHRMLRGGGAVGEASLRRRRPRLWPCSQNCTCEIHDILFCFCDCFLFIYLFIFVCVGIQYLFIIWMYRPQNRNNLQGEMSAGARGRLLLGEVMRCRHTDAARVRSCWRSQPAPQAAAPVALQFDNYFIFWMCRPQQMYKICGVR